MATYALMIQTSSSLFCIDAINSSSSSNNRITLLGNWSKFFRKWKIKVVNDSNTEIIKSESHDENHNCALKYSKQKLRDWKSRYFSELVAGDRASWI